MKRFFLSLISVVAGMICLTAQEKPAITLHTSIYDGYGDTNAFTLVVGGTEAGYIDVDCGFGLVEYELQEATFDQTSQSITGTVINCHVSEEGIVRIYCDDPARLDYFDGLGCFIRSIEFAHPEALQVLNLEHNELESLDLSGMTNLEALYLSDNPFNVEPFSIGIEMPHLQILDISILENIDPAFSFSRFPALVSVDAMSTHGLLNADVASCPDLVRLSLDNTNVATVDVSNNPALRILNVSDTRVTELDLTHNPLLEQLYASHYAAMNSGYKIHKLSLNHNPEMIYLFVSGNALTELDCSGMSKLRELVASHNRLESINLEGCESLINVDIKGNCLDFNTLPIDPGYWSDYIGQQSDMPMPRTVAVGDVIDLKTRVIRDDSETFASVFSVSRNNPAVAVPVSEDEWTFDDGKIVFNSAPADSVYVEFYNPTFQEFGLQTSRFKVKTAEELGKPALALMFNPIYLGSGDNISFGIGIDGASEESPKQIHVDWGNGELRAYNVTAFNGQHTVISDIKPSYGAVKVFVEGDDVVTDLAIENIYSSEVDVTRLDELRHLTLRDLELYDIDLRWNRCLQTLVLTGNHFSQGIDLQGANGWYGKNVLTHINLSNNELTGVEFNDVFLLKHIDFSHNKIESFNFKDADSLEYINLSYNEMTELVINYCCSLREADFSHNKIASVRMPETNVLEKFAIDNNCLTLATLPEHGNMSDENYKYAPQAKIEIPAKGPGHNLSSQYVEIDGQVTNYTWKATAGEILTEGVDYTIDKGVTNFLDPTIGKNLYCEISHPAFPAFRGANVLKTTAINSAGMPTNCLATFVTPIGGEKVRLSMTATRPATAIYIDWRGDDTLTQYILTDEIYTVFEAETTAGAEVKVYSYSNVSNLSVFSVTGATMESIDASGMKQVTAFSINDAGLEDGKIVFPRVTGLQEISLENNKLTSFDFTPFTRLAFCSLNGNNIKTLDVSKAASTLEVLTLSKNGLEQVTFSGNNKLWGLALNDNKLTEVDFHGAPALYQLFLNNNLLDNVDLSYLSQLRIIYLDGNRFDFSTLPLPSPNWTLYTYGNQPEVKIEDGSVVDLGYLAKREGVATEFKWYYDIPFIDLNTGEITGEELYLDDEYTIEDGVTTFHSDIDRACCVMTNSLFPNTYLITNVITASKHVSAPLVGCDDSDLRVRTSGLNITIFGLDDASEVQLIAADGRTVATFTATASPFTVKAPAPGLYILASPKGSVKLSVK